MQIVSTGLKFEEAVRLLMAGHARYDSSTVADSKRQTLKSIQHWFAERPQLAVKFQEACDWTAFK
jgi:hypothetical protein